jgi:predicted dehydrogenase
MLLPMANDGLTESDIWTRFALAIHEGPPPAVPVETVLPTMALIDAARRSSESCQAIEVRELVRWTF